jgi:hypothetical protein
VELTIVNDVAGTLENVKKTFVIVLVLKKVPVKVIVPPVYPVVEIPVKVGDGTAVIVIDAEDESPALPVTKTN